jgi:hypothetical protein
MPGQRKVEQALDAGLILGGSAGILQISQQGRGLPWRQGEQCAIQEHIARPFLQLRRMNSVRLIPSAAAA